MAFTCSRTMVGVYFPWVHIYDPVHEKDVLGGANHLYIKGIYHPSTFVHYCSNLGMVSYLSFA